MRDESVSGECENASSDNDAETDPKESPLPIRSSKTHEKSIHCRVDNSEKDKRGKDSARF